MPGNVIAVVDDLFFAYGDDALDLVERALPGRLVEAPAQEAGAVTETARREVVVSDLHDKLGRQWLPFGGAGRAPAARPSGGAAGIEQAGG